MRFAVAATNTSGGFSCIQVRKDDRMRSALSPRSPPSPRPFSISSIQSTAGAADSISRRALSKVASGLAWRFPCTMFMSSRNSGTRQVSATTLAQRLLPQPLTPMIRMPFGIGSPASSVFCVNTRVRAPIHSLSRPRPPTCSMAAS